MSMLARESIGLGLAGPEQAREAGGWGWGVGVGKTEPLPETTTRASQGSVMRHWVLLRHDTPDGGHHFDWMLEGGPDGTLITFRTAERVDEHVNTGEGEFECEALADHRAVYLDYEGEISGGRGSVRRVAQGELKQVLRTENTLSCAVVRPDGVVIRIQGACAGNAWWRMRLCGPR